MNFLAPSILHADFTKLGEQINLLKRAGVTYLHFDVMDGIFVPNISIGLPVLESVRKFTDMTLDVHLMISKPEIYIERFAETGADIINFHIEAVDNPLPLIRKIKRLGKLPAMAVNPNTDIENIYRYIDELYMVLIMSVEPGFGGQIFKEYTLEKVVKLREYALHNNIDISIEMDGGICHNTIEDVIASGVNIAVIGSAIFDADDIPREVKCFMRAVGDEGANIRQWRNN